MAINEIFENPTVKEVIFAIRFPALFYMESKIGELQLKIMDKFPNTSLSYQRQVVFADIGPEGKFENIPDELDKGKRKIWQFSSKNDYSLNVTSNSLSIVSKFHKTYNNPGSPNRFRDIIDFVLINFFKTVKVPILNRIGLRYIDDCPIFEKKDVVFRDCYNTKFPLDKFSIENAVDMSFMTLIKMDRIYLRYIESLMKSDEKYFLRLDFDAYSTDIGSDLYLEVTDKLHNIISNEYERTLKDKIFENMRKKKGE